MFIANMPMIATPRTMSRVAIRAPASPAALIGRSREQGQSLFSNPLLFLPNKEGLSLFSHRLEREPGEASPEPFERAVAVAVEPKLRPDEDQRPDERHREPGLEPAKAAVEAEAPAEEDRGGDQAGAEIVG